ncbi:hypothetical protein [Prosthecomicrobium hirschii]|uniref:hypothetical protein n=1 Tax=Prosthecodimorpha hirschii TaxID=665126 RepID=UPI00221F4F75|nr:hypothetical protein [Prosthecomicrobium hirschii]MCW1843780.1 hypothetical protein [Prosthecomicrobium hirschii]
MKISHRLRAPIRWLAERFAKKVAQEISTSRILMMQGTVAATQLRTIDKINTLADVEVSVFSQWGEDGIIEWLIQNCSGIPESFIEFGVENYTEANTRFLLAHRNWRGLVIDGSVENIAFIKNDPISWRHDITARSAFITRENINKLIADAGFKGEIGLLSVDLDGMDYWVWQAITQVQPWIVIVEYNALYGDLHNLVTPYDPAFVRSIAHPSGLYCGASIGALTQLAHENGYTLLGSNLAGNNAFFIRNDHSPALRARIANTSTRPSRFREERDAYGKLTLARGRAGIGGIMQCRVVDVATGREGALASFGELYSATWGAVYD